MFRSIGPHWWIRLAPSFGALNLIAANIAAWGQLGEEWRGATRKIRAVQIKSTGNSRPRLRLNQPRRRNVMAQQRKDDCKSLP